MIDLIKDYTPSLEFSSNNLFTIEAMLLIIFTLLANKIRLFSTNLYYRAFTNILGTLFHELAHFIMALCFFKIPKSISIWPKKENVNYHNYGRIEIAYGDLNMFNQTPISLAPILIIPLIVLNENILSWSMEICGDSIICKCIFTYLMVVLITNSLPSKSDLHSAFISKSFLFWLFLISTILILKELNIVDVIALIIEIIKEIKRILND